MNHRTTTARHRTVALRGLAVWTAITTGCGALIWSVAGGAFAPHRLPRDFTELVLQAATAGAVAAAIALWCLATSVAADLWRHPLSDPTRAQSRAQPRAQSRIHATGPLRRLLYAACGVTLAASLTATPSLADTGAPPVTLAGLPLPDRALGAPPRPDRQPAASTVVVQPGDSVWSMAVRCAPPDADVASYWREVMALNRTALDPNPDLIRPGLVLHLPPPSRSHS